MCGISGTLSFPGEKPVQATLLERMNYVQQHRGPDSSGLWISPARDVGFGFRRLAIVDLDTKANQPMPNEDESLHLVFNGEIYNHKEIRRELEAKGGHSWKTDHSDSEVIVHAYEEWGVDCLHHFRGMFAFALWDERRRHLWLARDRMGVKPLYYTWNSRFFSFASEIKALLVDPRIPRRMNEEAFFHFLSFLVSPAPQTLFEGILKIPAGCSLLVRPGTEPHLTRYWDAARDAVPQGLLGEADATAELTRLLDESIRLRKVSDVPMGVFLSGGIDSSLNTVLFARGEKSPVHTFSLGYEKNHPSYQNEFAYARTVATQTQSNHHEVQIGERDLLDFMPRMVELQDEPIVDPVCIPVYFLSMAARKQGVIVCQVGEGADELFCGYPFWDHILRWDYLGGHPMARPWLPLMQAGLTLVGKKRSLAYEQLRRLQLHQPIFWGGAEAFSQVGKSLLLGERLKKKFSGFTSWEAIRPIYERFTAGCRMPGPVHWMSYLDLSLRLPELLLMRVDKMSMGASIECRVPYLDHRLVEFVMGLPEKLLYHPGQPKRLLKMAARPFLPASILNRPKQGFGLPLVEWFLSRLGKQAALTLKEFARKTDYLDPREIDRLLALKKAGQLWYLYNFALWHEQSIEKSPPIPSLGGGES